MGLDLYFCCDCSDECIEYNCNYTYNVSRMWYKIYPDHNGMVYIDNMTCKEAIPILMNAIIKLLCNPDEFEEMNPENGWGDYDSFLQFLIKIHKFCVSHVNNNPNCETVWTSSR